MLERIDNLFEENDNDRVGFIQVRLAAGKPKKTPARKPPKAKDNEKNLSYNACPPDIQAKLRQCRAKEWQKWKEFNAGVILSKAELQELLDDGVKVNPMQWVETDKNGFKRRHDKSIPPDLKSRLVGCGNSKKQMDFEQILPLAMWMPTTSYSLGVHRIK